MQFRIKTTSVYLLLVGLLISLSINLKGADKTSFVMSAPNVVEVGEQFKLTLTLNERPKSIKPPQSDNFNILYGPSVTQKSGYSNINGKTTRTKEYSYTYVLSANAKGKFTLESAIAEVGRNQVNSNTIKIDVVEDQSSNQNNNNQTSSQSRSTNRRNTQADNSTKISNKDLFLKTSLSSSSVYKGEHIVVETKLYARSGIDITGFDGFTDSDYEGFWSTPIEEIEQVKFNREEYKGQIFNVGTLRKTLIVPQQLGDIKIDSPELGVVINQRVSGSERSPFGGFFSSSRRVNFPAKGNTRTVKVKSLPKAPASFTNGVGRFSMRSSISDTSIVANDAITIKVVVKGNGNIKLIQPPKLELPADFEIYDPQTDSNYKISEAGIRGEVTFSYLFQPRFEGEYTIPPIEFTYFDTRSKTYKTEKSSPYVIKVAKGEVNSTGSSIITNTQEDVKFLGQDIRFINTESLRLNNKQYLFFGSDKYYGIILFEILTLILIYFLYQKRIRDNANISGMKNKKANKVARKRLKQANIYLKEKNSDLFYEEIAKVLWGYISDKLTIPHSALNKDNCSESLSAKGVKTETITAFISSIDKSEFARFSPGSESEKMESLYNEATEIMEQMEREIKR